MHTNLPHEFPQPFKKFPCFRFPKMHVPKIHMGNVIYTLCKKFIMLKNDYEYA